MIDDQWGLRTLLDMDGQRGEVGGGYWFKIEAHAVPPSRAVPHGVKYSLTLHVMEGPRIFGIDNAHAPKVTGERRGPGRVRRIEYDHQHLGQKVSFYEYVSAQDLPTDFFAKVDAIVKERGVRP
ncbi:hypothetical protein [Azospirillum endophyticum]